MRIKSVAAFLIVWLGLCLAGYAQVVLVSTNPKAVTMTQDAYLIGGAVTFTFSDEFASNYDPPVKLIITLDRPDLLFDTTRPPIAYKNGWDMNGMNVVASPYEIAILLQPRMYLEGFKSVTVKNFYVDAMGVLVPPGTFINASVNCTDDRISFSNPQFRLFTTAVPRGRR